MDALSAVRARLAPVKDALCAVPGLRACPGWPWGRWAPA